MAKLDGPYHVVAHTLYEPGRPRPDRLITYVIYCNNRIFAKPRRGKKLTRFQAHAICRHLNANPHLWIEQPMTRDELMKVR